MTEPTSNGEDRVHELLIERADSDYRKRLNDKQKRFGKSHDIDEELREKSEIALLNNTAMVALMHEYNLLIPARTMHLWRPTLRSKGSVQGIRDGLELIATDGILGYFVLPTETDEKLAWLGHISHFDGKIEPLFSFHGPMASKSKVKKERKKREKSKRQLLIESI